MGRWAGMLSAGRPAYDICGHTGSMPPPLAPATPLPLPLPPPPPTRVLPPPSPLLQTFGMTLIPSIVNLALANTSPTAIEQGQAFIDCVGWTNALREAIDTDGERALLPRGWLTIGCRLQASSHCADMPAPQSSCTCPLSWRDAGWRPPVHYKVAPLTDLFSFPKIWPAVRGGALRQACVAVSCRPRCPHNMQPPSKMLPRFIRSCSLPLQHPTPPCPLISRLPHPALQDMRPWLLNVQRRLFKFITSCGFLDDFDDWQTAIAANPYYSACPVVDPRCVKGTYESRRGGCLSCYNDGTSIGPYCNSTAVLACTAKSCYCERPFAPAA